MVARVDVVVIGAGAMGSAAAWQLARRGRSVLVLERFSAGHDRGASHGATRNFNVAYADDTYADLLVEARRLWDELAAETGSVLLDLVGLVDHGRPEEFDAIDRALRTRGLTTSRLRPEEAAERWAGMRFGGEVLHVAESGRVRAAEALTALWSAARRHGAEIRERSPVHAIEVLGGDRVRVHTDVDAIEADRAVVTVGAWSQRLLGGLVELPRLLVTQEQPAHFAVTDPGAAWPSFNHRRRPGDLSWYGDVYGMLTPGQGVKAGWHGAGPVVDPDRRSFEPEPAQLDALREYVAAWLPGADPNRCVPISCTYTSTSSEDFLLDRVGPLVVGAGFSGHGFKFAPAVGRVLADLALGRSGPALFSSPLTLG